MFFAAHLDPESLDRLRTLGSAGEGKRPLSRARGVPKVGVAAARPATKARSTAVQGRAANRSPWPRHTRAKTVSQMRRVHQLLDRLERGGVRGGEDVRHPSSATAKEVTYLIGLLARRNEAQSRAGQRDDDVTAWVRVTTRKAERLIGHEQPLKPPKVLKVGPFGPVSLWYYEHADEGR